MYKNKQMKNCPYCKKIIVENNDNCPHCGRVLVERINTNYSQRPNNISQNTKTLIKNKLKNYFKQLKNKLNNYFKQLNNKSRNLINSFKKHTPITIIVVILLLIIFSNTKKENINTTPVSVIPNTSEPYSVSVIPTKDPKTYVSLPNGYVFRQDSNNFLGFGELKINNGTSSDAIAKLINIATDKSVLNVYIKANNIYNISKISDGNYKLMFNLGNDWDADFKAFTVNSSYEVFEENFDFTTSESEYSTFSVTLNPIIGGDAKTNAVKPIEFGNY